MYGIFSIFAVLSSSGVITLPFSFIGKKYGLKKIGYLKSEVVEIKENQEKENRDYFSPNVSSSNNTQNTSFFRYKNLS